MTNYALAAIERSKRDKAGMIHSLQVSGLLISALMAFLFFFAR